MSMYKRYELPKGSKVPPIVRKYFSGDRVEICVCDSVEIPATAGLWDGGSRDLFYCDPPVDTGYNNMTAPWDSGRKNVKVVLSDNVYVMRQTTFRGKDMGVTVYMNENTAKPYIPKIPEVSAEQKKVLEIIRSLKSQFRKERALQSGFTPARYEAIIEELKSMKLLDSRGAITADGRNASR